MTPFSLVEMTSPVFWTVHTLQSRHLPRKLEYDWIELTDHFRWLHCLQFGHCFDFSIFQWCVPKNGYKISFITFPSQFYDNEMILKEKKMNYFGKLELQFAHYFFLDITFPSHFYDNLMESYIPQYFSKLISIPLWWKCDGTVVQYLSSKIEPSHLHHIFITYLWQWDDAERS